MATDYGKLKANAPVKFHPLIDRAAGGSRAAAMKLFCISCCGYDRKEVEQCRATLCPLHSFKPYLSKEEKAAKAAGATP